MDWFNIIVLPLFSSIVVGLIAYVIHNRVTTKKAHRIHRRQLTGLISEIDSNMIIKNDEEAKALLSKRLRRIVDTFDIATEFSPKVGIHDGKPVKGSYHKEKVGDE